MSPADPHPDDESPPASNREFERYALVAALTLLVLCLLWVDGRSEPSSGDRTATARLLRVEIGDRTGASATRRASRPVEPPADNRVPPPTPDPRVDDEPPSPPRHADPVKPEPIDTRPPPAPVAPPRSADRLYTVKPRETLSGIASRELGSASRATEIAKLNGIDDPRRLRAGATIRLPAE